MASVHSPIIFLPFLVSGFCGLLYEVAWIRLAYAPFGIITPVLSVEKWGFHLIASKGPITPPSVEGMIAKMPPEARRDLMEWFGHEDLRTVVANILYREVPLGKILNTDESIVITDDRPYNEYYLLRRLRDRPRGDYRFVYQQAGVVKGRQENEGLEPMAEIITGRQPAAPA